MQTYTMIASEVVYYKFVVQADSYEEARTKCLDITPSKEHIEDSAYFTIEELSEGEN